MIIAGKVIVSTVPYILHEIFESTENGWFLNSREWTTSLLKQGDVQILDSMTLHAATANVSKARRALLYFTFRNPKCLKYGMEGTPTITKGSLHDDVKLCFADYNPRRGGDV